MGADTNHSEGVPSPVGVAIIVLALPVIALEAVRLLLE
jgi:hypothetical protein